MQEKNQEKGKYLKWLKQILRQKINSGKNSAGNTKKKHEGKIWSENEKKGGTRSV